MNKLCLLLLICGNKFYEGTLLVETSLSPPKSLVYAPNMQEHLDYSSFQLLVAGGYRPLNHTLAQYVVSIRTATYSAYFGDNHFCAGVFVSPQLILTAAHCLINADKTTRRPNELLVVAGTTNRLRQDTSTVEFRVKEVIPHKRFRHKNGVDLALLRLSSSMPENNEHFGVISIPQKHIPVGTHCTILGWGRLFTNGPYAAELIYAEMSIVPPSRCMEKYPNSFGRGMICAYDATQPAKNACPGDSGGPLVCNGELAGIISWGMQCKPGYPTVLTSAPSHLMWLKRIFDIEN